MKRIGLLALLLLMACAVPCAAARHDEAESVGPLSLLNYTVSGGGIIPAGTAGEGIDSGPHANAAIHYDSGSGFMFGGEVGYTRSKDDLRTRIVEFGVTARISPADYNAAYVQLGLGGYALGYRPRTPLVPNPGDMVRPGGSFGVGFELVRIPRMAFGVSGTYHRVAITSHDARAFVALKLDVTFRPYEF
jgi:hypothetical protein